MLMRSFHTRAIVSLFVLTFTLGTALAADNPFLGGQERTFPGGA